MVLICGICRQALFDERENVVDIVRGKIVKRVTYNDNIASCTLDIGSQLTTTAIEECGVRCRMIAKDGSD